MPLPQPNLDDRTYADLVDEARALIPTYDPSWTDHNPSDPGITLIELFAWLTEMLIYRANRVPDQHKMTFLKLLNGPGWEPGPDLAEDIRTSAVALRERYRAVTCEDYEALAKEASENVARTKCVPRRYLGAGTEADRTAPRPGHVSIVIVPRSTDPAPQPSEELCRTVWDYLDPRRVLTTRHCVTGPVYAPVSAEILIARRSDVTDVESMPGRPTAVEELLNRVVKALEEFLHPLKGGPDGDGWAFGRDIYVSELYQLLESIPGVDYVPDIVLLSACKPEDRRCVAAEAAWHDNGDLIGLRLFDHHLPQARVVEFLFSIGVEFQDDLDKGGSISKDLQQEFKKNGISLSPNSTARIMEKGSRWLITDKDNNQIYALRKEEAQLNIYDMNSVIISATFVPVKVTIRVSPAESVLASAVRRAVKTVVMRLFHPLHDGSDDWTKEARTVTSDSIRTKVMDLPEVVNVINVNLEVESTRLIRDEQGDVTAVRIEARELADVQVAVEVS